MTSVWGVSAVAILDSSVNCVCVWATKKLSMPAYCVAANCNNSQTTPGITMHELPRNRPAVRRKWIKFIQFKRADFLAAPHHAHLCSEHFSECENRKPHGIPHGVLLRSWHDVPVLFKNPAWRLSSISVSPLILSCLSANISLAPKGRVSRDCMFFADWSHFTFDPTSA